MKEISVKTLKQKLDNNEPIQILDVRELSEYQLSNLGGSLIPLGELSSRLDELDPTQAIAVLCRSGVRSAKAAMLLHHFGFEDVCNIQGGILAWAKEIDPNLAVG